MVNSIVKENLSIWKLYAPRMGNHVFRMLSVCLVIAPAILLISCQHAIPPGTNSPTADPLSEYELSGESNEVNTALRL